MNKCLTLVQTLVQHMDAWMRFLCNVCIIMEGMVIYSFDALS